MVHTNDFYIDSALQVLSVVTLQRNIAAKRTSKLHYVGGLPILETVDFTVVKERRQQIHQITSRKCSGSWKLFKCSCSKVLNNQSITVCHILKHCVV